MNVDVARYVVSGVVVDTGNIETDLNFRLQMEFDLREDLIPCPSKRYLECAN